MAHPFDDGTAAVLARSVAETAASFGPRDAGTYRRLVAPFLGKWDTLASDFMSLPLTALPRDPVTLARFGLTGLPPSTWLMRRFRDERAAGTVRRLVAHVIAPLDGIATGAVGLIFALAAHAARLARATRRLPVHLRRARRLPARPRRRGPHRTSRSSGSTTCRRPAPTSSTPRRPPSPASQALGDAYRDYRYGPGVFKIDYALDGPVPWTAAEARGAPAPSSSAPTARRSAPRCAGLRADRRPPTPFLITAQPSRRRPLPRPQGQHVFWAYGHVPNGWQGDLTEAVERQIERFAPGLPATACSPAPPRAPPNSPPATPTTSAATSPAARPPACSCCCAPGCPFPYTTPHPAVFLCSSATPPGPGVHGMSGHNAAKAVWRRLRQA